MPSHTEDSSNCWKRKTCSKRGIPNKESKKSQFQQQKLGGEACTVKLDDPTNIADTTIAYIRDGNMGKAITAMTSYGLAPVNDDTVTHFKDLLIPTKPKPVWADTRAEFGPRAAQLGEERVPGLIRTTPQKVRGGRLRVDI